MADEDIHAAEAGAEPPAHEPPTPEVREMTAAERLRAFEDDKLGVDCVRIGGLVERGYGSPFQTKLNAHDRRIYALIEKLEAAEQAHASAASALIAAEVAHDAAKRAVDAAAEE